MNADLVVRDASVFTAVEGSGSAAGFAVKNGKFVFVTNKVEELEPFIADGTTVYDMAGAAVVPGLFDAHIHHSEGGKMLYKQLQISSALPLDGVLAAIDRYSQNLGENSTWVTGGAWGSTLLPEINSLDALRRLDQASNGHPVLLVDDSHHNAWANTAALSLAGVYEEGSTGVLIEGNVAAVRDAQAAAEPDSLEDLKEYVLASWQLLHSYGVTAIQDALVTMTQLEALVALDQERKLKGWVSSSLIMAGPLATPGVSEEAYDQYARKVHSDRVRTNFTKLILDGVPPTQTSGFLGTYLPSEEFGCNHHGTVYMTVDELVEVLRRYRSQGRHSKIHCTGDWTVQVAMDAFEAMRREGSTQTYQIAHGQFVTAQDRQRMKALDVVAEISPFLWYPGVIPKAISAVLPEEIASRMQPNRDLLDLGVLVAGGSDWPVSAVPNPWEGIGGLVTRQDPTSQFPGTLWKEQAVTVEEALRIFTINGAKAAGLDDVVGSIEPGKSANFVFTDSDPLKVDASKIGTIKVLRTFVAGEEVYTAPESPSASS